MCNPLRCEYRNPRGVKDQVRITGIAAHELLSNYPHTDAVEVTIYEQDGPASASAFVTLKLNR